MVTKKSKKVMHPIDREILRALIKTRIKVTPSQVAKSVGVHPTTAQKRTKNLTRQGFLISSKRGNRTYLKAKSKKEVKKKIKKFNWLE